MKISNYNLISKKGYFVFLTLIVLNPLFSIGGVKTLPMPILSNENRMKLDDLQKKMKQISDSMIDGTSPLVRTKALRDFVPLLKLATSIKSSFSYQFDSLKFLKQLTPPDASFKIFNWLIKFDDGSYKYFAALQYNHPDSLKLIPFFDQSSNMDENLSFQILNPKNWYGALYNQVIQSKIKGKIFYLLTGWNGYDQISDKKIIEVMTFDKINGIQFGAPIFKYNDTIQNRIVFWYNAKSAMVLNYLSDVNVFSFDHLSPEKKEFEGKEWTYVPSGSYNYLQFKKGFWEFKEDLFSGIKKPIGAAGE